MTIKERLHKLVDEMSEGEADEALRFLAQRRSDPIIAAFCDAPDDDEPVTAADEQALAEAHADRDAGAPRISYAEIKGAALDTLADAELDDRADAWRYASNGID